MTDGEAVFEAPTSRVDRLRFVTSLAPVRHRNWWIAAGLVVQLTAVGMLVAWVYERAKHEAVAGAALKSTVLVAAREVVHTRSGVLVLVASAVVFALGSVLLARPFVRSLGTLVVAVPLAALTGMLVLGALAIVVAAVAALVYAGFDDLGGGGGGGSGGAKKKRGDKAVG